MEDLWVSSPHLLSYVELCHRKFWITVHGIRPESTHPLLAAGRTAQHNRRDPHALQDVHIEGMQWDLVRRSSGHLVIGEVKRGASQLEMSRTQLLWYLYRLELSGIHATGELVIIKPRTVISVTLTDADRVRLAEQWQIAEDLALSPQIPPRTVIPACRSCAYRDWCDSGKDDDHVE